MHQKIIQLFLSSSDELKEDRKEFELAISRKNAALKDQNIFIETIVWENFSDNVTSKGLQEEYHEKVRACDIFILLFFSKVGRYTLAEFNVAHRQFKKTGSPIIFTYFKNASIDYTTVNERDLMSLVAFKKKLKSIGHYYTSYDTADGLKYHFTEQLDKLNITSAGATTIAGETQPKNQFSDYANRVKIIRKPLVYSICAVALLLLLFAVIHTMTSSDPETITDDFMEQESVIVDESLLEIEPAGNSSASTTINPDTSATENTGTTNEVMNTVEAPTPITPIVQSEIPPISFNTGSQKMALVYYSHSLARKDTFEIDRDKTVQFLKNAIQRHYQITIPKEFLGRTDENVRIQEVLVANHQNLYQIEKKLSEVDLDPYDVIEFDYRRISSLPMACFIPDVLVTVENLVAPDAVLRLNGSSTSSKTSIKGNATLFYFDRIGECNPKDWMGKLSLESKSYFLSNPIQISSTDTLKVQFKLTQ